MAAFAPGMLKLVGGNEYNLLNSSLDWLDLRIVVSLRKCYEKIIYDDNMIDAS